MCAFSCNAMALPTSGLWDYLDDDYVVSTSMDYWTRTDFTTAVDGTSLFQLKLELAYYESSFGLYTFDADTGVVDLTYEIFKAADEPTPWYYISDTQETLTIKEEAGDMYVTTSYDVDNNNDEDNKWVLFDSVFGFYFSVSNTGNTFYTDSSLNTSDEGVDHIVTAYNANTKDVYIFLNDNITGDEDYNDMVVFANDLQPVPEPSTLILFGAGILGLAGYTRKRSNKKAYC